MTFNTTQVLQLTAFMPCILLAIHLLVTSRCSRQVIVPVIYFLVLAGNFTGAMSGFLGDDYSDILRIFRIISENMLAAAAFLIIIQSIYGKVPPAIYWLILALPLFGGGPITYLALTTKEICIEDSTSCIATSYINILYRLVSGAIILLLLMFVVGRKLELDKRKEIRSSSSYLLIVSLIGFNLILLGLDLFYVMGKIKDNNLDLLRAGIGIVFVYMSVSSVFRVFYTSFQVKPLQIMYKKEQNFAKERKITELIEKLMKEDKLYREVGFNRATLAERLGINEALLSRVINVSFKKSFSELMNYYKLEDAKEKLADTDQQITIIAFDSGFSSLATFNRVFKSATNQSPTEYRLKARQERKQNAPS